MQAKKAPRNRRWRVYPQIVYTYTTGNNAKVQGMIIREKDYRYLLLKLVPLHRLERHTRREIGRALDGRDHAVLRRVSLDALECLCESGYYVRTGSERRNGDALITYQRAGGRVQVRLLVPANELETAPEPGRPESASAAVPAAGVDVSFHIIPEILRSFSITDERESMFERLAGTIQLLPAWFRVSAVRLVLVEERLGEDADGDIVKTESEKDILRKAANEHCRRTGNVEFLHPDAAVALGMDRPRRVNRDAEEPGLVAVSPLFSAGEFWGILELWLPGDDDGPRVRSRIEVATGMIEQMIENSVRLENLTSLDKLTGVYNRNFYDTQVRIEIERAKRSASKLAMLVMDIDDFKPVNDTYGHRRGDQALMLVADAIKANLRKIDLAFRYGGEEFVVLLPGTSQVEAVHTAERLRSVIADISTFKADDGTAIPLRVSIGAAVYPDHADNEDALFRKADGALYRAKAAGKNRVEIHTEP